MWKIIQEKNAMQMQKKNIFLYPVKDIKIPEVFKKNPKVPRNVMGFSNRAQLFELKQSR